MTASTSSARVVLLAGPSGSGKTRLARRLGLPVLHLDDFYREGTDPGLPHVALPGTRIVDWDDPGSWDVERAVAALRELCASGRTEVPVYDLAASARVGHRLLERGGAAYVMAEGIFAQEVVAPLQALGLLHDAVCVTQHPLVTFGGRLARDLREHRKPPWVLVRRGVHLLRRQRAVVGRARRLGCRVLGPEEAYRELGRLRTGAAGGT